MIIAIDGPSASGKGTVARRLAGHFNLPYLDTGLLYRFVALSLQKQGATPDDMKKAVQAAVFLRQNIKTIGFDDDTLRSHGISQPSSVVAAMPEVRRELLDLQKEFAHQPGGAVLDGRDIGTVIAPDANIKIYVTASVNIRAHRRMKELQSKGHPVTYEAVLKDLQARDARDAERATAPAKPADDAVVLDTSDLNADQAFAAALRIVKEKTGRT